MTEFKQAIQIGSNVTDIMQLPCVRACVKMDDKQGHEWLEYRIMQGQRIDTAEEGDWLVESVMGRWYVLSDESYKKISGW